MVSNLRVYCEAKDDINNRLLFLLYVDSICCEGIMDLFSFHFGSEAKPVPVGREVWSFCTHLPS
jgi:hypothetical protein